MRNLTELANIVLMGFMGTGKSSVGIRLAEKLGRQFYDSDQEIEKVMGMAVKDIFTIHGEKRFRAEEKLALKRLSAQTSIILATGGGAVVDPDNLTFLKSTGVLISLEATPEVIFERTARKGTRPLLKTNDPAEAIKKLLAEREGAYAQGDFRIDTSHKTLDEVVDIILLRLEEIGSGQSRS